MQIRIGQCDEAARRWDREGIVFVVGQRKRSAGREGSGCEKEVDEGQGDNGGLAKRERGWIRLRSATAADPGNSDGVGPKALSVAGKPPRSDNTLYIARRR